MSARKRKKKNKYLPKVAIEPTIIIMATTRTTVLEQFTITDNVLNNALFIHERCESFIVPMLIRLTLSHVLVFNKLF